MLDLNAPRKTVSHPRLRQLLDARGDQDLDTELREHQRQLRRDDVSTPVVFVGTGTCGLGAGAAATLAAIKQYTQEQDLAAEVVEVGCIGLCSAEPLVEVQLPGRGRLMYEHVTEDQVPALLGALLGGRLSRRNLVCQHRQPELDAWHEVPFLDEHAFFAPQTRWVLKNCGLIDPGSIDEYIARGGYRALSKALGEETPADIRAMVVDSGLRGRGGGGFPAGVKWRFAAETEADQRYLICNADEGDPGAFMDRAVIEGDPHRLVEGMALAAYAIGASKAYIYIRAEYPLAIARLHEALAQARDAGLLGEGILDSDFALEIRIKEGAGAFVCGEETALIHSIEGKRGMPRPRPPFPAKAGLFGKPTIINNVETLSNLPLLVDHGPEWFAAVGTEGSKGTKVFALSGKVNRTGLVEVAMGTSVRQIVMDIGGGVEGGKAYKAVQIGGPSGGCIPEEHIDIQVDYESLKTVGAMMGSGGLVVMDEDTCMVDVAMFFMDFIQRESCGKCIPCREGTRRMLETLQGITHGRGREQQHDALTRFRRVMYLERLAEVIRDTSLCGLGQSAPNPVLSTLRWFRDEYEGHVFDRECSAGVCKELLRYEIDQVLCVGCTLCARKCPSNAIVGGKKKPHQIILDRCIGCGGCVELCSFNAISVS
jgi:NADH:ubiquinone oxidoreductase subunit F (NADH-binding)/Pyruvate/2-oxoacid:ferredoxin oxidoreductase delta subunit/(2Fe-2S) ferredoxin